jgi:hypothetical protein
MKLSMVAPLAMLALAACGEKAPQHEGTAKPIGATNAGLFSSSQAEAGGAVWGQAIGVTSIVFGSASPTTNSPAQIIIFTGLLKITKQPVHTLASGRRQIALQFDSVMPNGAVAVRSADTPFGFVRVAVDPDEAGKSIGTLTEIPPAAHPKMLEGPARPELLSNDHPHESASGKAELYLIFEPGQGWHGPPFKVLRNKDPVILAGHIHHVPPVTAPIKLVRNMTPEMLRDIVSAMPNADKWVGANKTPIALVDENGRPQAWFTANVHVTTLTGVCGDHKDNDLDGRVDEELPNNKDDDGDGFVDEDSTCPAV